MANTQLTQTGAQVQADLDKIENIKAVTFYLYHSQNLHGSGGGYAYIKFGSSVSSSDYDYKIYSYTADPAILFINKYSETLIDIPAQSVQAIGKGIPFVALTKETKVCITVASCIYGVDVGERSITPVNNMYVIDLYADTAIKLVLKDDD